jgi:hypothetical protein
MCDIGCAVTFTADKVTVKHGTATILNGEYDPGSGLWRVTIEEPAPGQSSSQHMAHIVYEKKSLQDTIAYLHDCCFSPVQDMWIKVIEKGHFSTWPVLIVDNFCNYLPKYDAMVKGYMNQIRQNIKSTQPKVAAPEPEPDMVQEEKCRYVYITVMETGQIYTDLTGRFPTTSISGKKYILVLYEYNNNIFFPCP